MEVAIRQVLVRRLKGDTQLRNFVFLYVLKVLHSQCGKLLSRIEALNALLEAFKGERTTEQTVFCKGAYRLYRELFAEGERVSLLFNGRYWKGVNRNLDAHLTDLRASIVALENGTAAPSAAKQTKLN